MAHRIVTSHCPVRTGQSGVLSGVLAIIQLMNSALSGFWRGSYLYRWYNSGLKSWRGCRLKRRKLNTGMLKNVSHEGLVLSPIC
jgi:hypothetical protein